jgi:TonB family protein
MLAIKTPDKQLARVYPIASPDDAVYVAQALDSGRLCVFNTKESWEVASQEAEYHLLWHGPARDLKEKGPVLGGALSQLTFIDEPLFNPVLKDVPSSQGDEDSSWRILVGTYVLSFLSFLLFYWLGPKEMNPRLAQEMEKKVEDIRQKVVKPKTVTQVKIQPMIASTTLQPVTKSQTTWKRMGALSALGELQRGAKTPGLNLGSAVTSAGPGLGGLQGSGGTQTSVYAKGMVAAPLGVGGNLQGAGGLGTKGKGGGQAGYGELKLAGSLGAQALPVGLESQSSAGLDRDQIAAVVAQNSSQVRFCYEQGLQENPGLAGRVTVDFVIGGNGLVKSARVSSSTLNDSSVENCIVQRLRSWKFPVPDGGVDVQVSYPFTLRRAGQG